MGPGSARFLLRSFKRILAVNTQVLEHMARMDRVLGGEYVFDRAFLDSAVRTVCGLTYQVVYHLNGMAGEAYVELYDAFLAVKDGLEDILAGGLGPLAKRRVLPFSELGWEMEPLAGMCAVGLAELKYRLGLSVPDGLAVTVTGLADLLGQDQEAALEEIRAGVQSLYADLGGPRALTLTLTAAGPNGQGRILAETRVQGAEEAAAALTTLVQAQDLNGPMAACLRPEVPALVRGTLQTLAHDPGLPPAMRIQASPPADPEARDRVWLTRAAPHPFLRSRIAPKPLPESQALSLARDGFMRGSAWLDPDQAAQLAEMGLACERTLGRPCVLAWTLDPKRVLWIDGVEAVTQIFPEQDETVASPPDPDQALLSGGQMARGGVAAGPVVQVTEDTGPESVPLGAIGVARAATPGLSRLLPRLGALLTEVGSPASHLATVAREAHIPALFGIKGAFSLTPGSLVTVDADQGLVFPGAVDSLLGQAATPGSGVGDDPEYLLLGRLLRLIRPLNLLDPRDPDFRAESCRTCHDIIHFAHEKAVELLLDLDAGHRSGLGAAVRLEEDSPFPLEVVDLGDGLADAPGPLTLAQVESRPLRAFLEGLLLKDVRRQTPARLSLRDIMAGLTRTGAALSLSPGETGRNLAIAARDYANISLRLGYHFSVVDAVVSDRPEHTFIYFRFAGGFADADRRARRAELILGVLERLDFAASRSGDLVVGKRKLMEADEALDVLRLLGALSAFTRQLDVDMISEQDIGRLIREFMDLARPVLGPALKSDREAP